MHPNVIAVLETSKIHFTIRKHADLTQPIKGPMDVANALGIEISQITKTLFVTTEDGSACGLAVCSMNKKVDFKVLGQALGVRRAQMGSPEKLKEIADYPQHGVSPFGVPEIPVFVDVKVLAHSSVLIGGGQVGVEIEIDPKEVVRLAEAKVLSFSV